MKYPAAEWVPWGYQGSEGRAYYRGTNRPSAVVLHIMEGWATTARQWAGQAHYGASWHFTVARDGSVMQHLEFADGGYQAGIAKWRDDARTVRNPDPTWPLWRGWEEDGAPNVNNYTIGVEHEGMSGTVFDAGLPFPPAQAAASRALCQWLATTLDIPFDRNHFPAHADIALIDRVNDFAPPALRERYYEYLFEEADMPDPRVDALITDIAELRQALTGHIDRLSQAIVLNDWLFARQETTDGKLDWNRGRATGYTLLGWTAGLNTALLTLRAQVEKLAEASTGGAVIDLSAMKRELQDVVDAIPVAAPVNQQEGI